MKNEIRNQLAENLFKRGLPETSRERYVNYILSTLRHNPHRKPLRCYLDYRAKRGKAFAKFVAAVRIAYSKGDREFTLEVRDGSNLIAHFEDYSCHVCAMDCYLPNDCEVEVVRDWSTKSKSGPDGVWKSGAWKINVYRPDGSRCYGYGTSIGYEPIDEAA